MIDNRLKSFLKLYECMNYRETAEALNITQPAVTQHIQSLEEELGCKLFLYEKRKLHACPSAKVLASYARSAIRNQEELRSALAKNEVRPIRIGATKSIGEFFLADYVAAYLRSQRREVEIQIENTSILLQELDADRLDFALIEGHYDRHRYASSLLKEEDFVGICHVDHPFAGREVPLYSVFSERLILREEGSGTRAIIEDVLHFSEYSVQDFRSRLCINNFGLIVRLVAAGCGISFVYQTVAQGFPGLASFRIQGLPIKHSFDFVYLPGSNGADLVQEFMGVVN